MSILKNAMHSKAVRLGLAGAVIGAFAPVLHTLLQLVLFYSDMSVAGYFHYAFTSKEQVASSIFIAGTIFVMGGAGFMVGRQRERDDMLRRKAEMTNMELRALNTVSAIASRSRDLDSMLYLVLKEVLSLPFLNIDRKGAIFLRDELDPDALRLAASIGTCAGVDEYDGIRKLDRYLSGKAAEAGEILTSYDLTDDRSSELMSASRNAHMLVPISGRARVLGVMTFYLPMGASPSEDDIRVLTAAANQLGVAIENVSLMRDITIANEDGQKKGLELARNAEVLNALVEVDRIIMSIPERDEMLFRVGSQIRQLMPADVGGIILKDPMNGRCSVVGCWGLDHELIHLSPECKLEGRMAGGETLFRTEFYDGEELSNIETAMRDAGVRSSCFVPIYRKGAVTGAFFIGSRLPDGISRESVRTAESFSSRMGMALEHSKLIYNLEDMSINIIHALATAIDAKSAWTKGHSERVAEYAVKIGARMGLAGRRVERLRLAGLLHDIGKIGTYDIILDKEGKLTDDELALIRQHPERGCEILAPIRDFTDIMPGVRYHHERWDGKGYPAGLMGDEIPVEAQIICVADAFDTMTADRPYRPSIGFDNAVQELKYCSGSQFSPEVASLFLEIINEKGPALIRQRDTVAHPRVPESGRH
ncbi:MAG TPA: HD domain-containing phosphohydrolase [Nitrospirota bacterium]|jgi:HD-GYP domain-containing protein (c-di-GMP phosphodiesterase class II)